MTEKRSFTKTDNPFFWNDEETLAYVKARIEGKAPAQIANDVFAVRQNPARKKISAPANIGSKDFTLFTEYGTKDFEVIYKLMTGQDFAAAPEEKFVDPLSFNKSIDKLVTEKENATYQRLITQAETMLYQDLGQMTIENVKNLPPKVKEAAMSILNGEAIERKPLKRADVVLFSYDEKTHLLLPVHYTENRQSQPTRQSLIYDGTIAQLLEEGKRAQDQQFREVTLLSFERSKDDNVMAKNLYERVNDCMKSQRNATEINVIVDKPYYNFLLK